VGEAQSGFVNTLLAILDVRVRHGVDSG
jgi:hypothetical protein